MNDTTISPAERIRAFAAAVRAELADLPEDDVEDLTGGLVGDLTDQAADSGGDIDFGDPIAYAHELRIAAGLPEKSDATAKPPLPQRVSVWWSGVIPGIRSSRFGAWLLDLLIALRPVWWVIRGAALYGLLALTIWPAGARDMDPVRFAALCAIVLVSVQWGRGRWLPKNWLRHVRTAASIVAIVALPGLISMALHPVYVDTGDSSPPDGLLLDGVQIGNLFVYDRDGELIDGAQIYTDKGTPLNLYGAQSEEMLEGWNQTGDGMVTIPMRDLQDRPIWNVYPLQEGLIEYDENGEPDASNVESPSPPFARAPQRNVEPDPTATPSPEPTQAQTPSPTPTEEPEP